MLEWIDQQFAEALATALLNSLWQGMAIVLVLLALDNVGAFRNPRQGYIAHMLGLLGVVLSTVFGFAFQHQRLHMNSHDRANAEEFVALWGPASASETYTLALEWQQILVLVWLAGMCLVAIRHIPRLFTDQVYQEKSRSYFE